MIEAYKNFFRGFADFSGRSTRPDFWWVWIMNTILSIPLYITYFQAVFTEEEVADPIASVGILSFYIIFYLVIFLPSIALRVRRLRDAGFHWAFIFLRFAPMGGIALLILHAMPTKETEVVNYSEPQAVNVEEVIEVTPFEDSAKN